MANRRRGPEQSCRVTPSLGGHPRHAQSLTLSNMQPPCQFGRVRSGAKPTPSPGLAPVTAGMPPVGLDDTPWTLGDRSLSFFSDPRPAHSFGVAPAGRNGADAVGLPPEGKRFGLACARPVASAPRSRGQREAASASPPSRPQRGSRVRLIARGPGDTLPRIDAEGGFSTNLVRRRPGPGPYCGHRPEATLAVGPSAQWRGGVTRTASHRARRTSGRRAGRAQASSPCVGDGFVELGRVEIRRDHRLPDASQKHQA